MRIERVALVLSAVGWLSQSGCSTTGLMGSARAIRTDGDLVSGTSYSYSAGRGIQDFAAASSAVKSAIDQAMEDLSMTVSHRRRDGTVSQVEGRTKDDRTVSVTVRPRKGMTQVSCRIGWFGDDPLSRTLLERVGVRLGTVDPAAIPEDPPSAPASNPIFSRDAIPDSVMLRDVAEAPYRDRPDL